MNVYNGKGNVLKIVTGTIVPNTLFIGNWVMKKLVDIAPRESGIQLLKMVTTLMGQKGAGVTQRKKSRLNIVETREDKLGRKP